MYVTEHNLVYPSRVREYLSQSVNPSKSVKLMSVAKCLKLRNVDNNRVPLENKQFYM